ncbi:MAG: glycosyltransferase family 9 protein [Deltaproteobacteria bacterium]|nr:glycosyltransferase family 9 protein [Deltaproteobacteria bacterium]
MLEKSKRKGLPTVKFYLLGKLMHLMGRWHHWSAGNRLVPAAGDVKRIVAFHFGGIGDTVLTTPALVALAGYYRDARISFIGSNMSHCSFLGNFPFVDEVKAFNIYALDSRRLIRPSCRKTLSTIVDDLRREPVDLFINFHSPYLIDWFFIEFLIVCLVRPRFSAGINPYFLKGVSVYDRWVSEDDLEGKHDKDFFADIVERLGIPVRNRETNFPVTEEDRRFADNFVRDLRLRGDRLVCLHPGGTAACNHWPVERYRRLTADLGRRGLKFIVIGAPDEAHLVEAICKDNPYALNFPGRTTLTQSAALIEKSALFIGSDSGPFHVAVAVRTPAIGIIGGGHPRFHLYCREDIRVIKKNVSCAPCRNWDCSEKDCIRCIEVDDVIRASVELLRNRVGRFRAEARS